MSKLQQKDIVYHRGMYAGPGAGSMTGSSMTVAGVCGGSASVTATDDYEEDAVKSESEASAAGHSPQATCSGHSESSSGVHSNSSQDTTATLPLPPPPPPLQLSSATLTPSPTDDEQRRRASYADLSVVDTVVIRHKGGPGAKARMPPDPCTRPTNVALSSFTEPRGARNRPGSVPGWRTMPHNAPVPPQPPAQTDKSHYHQYIPNGGRIHQQQLKQQQQHGHYQQRQWTASNGNAGGGGGGGVVSTAAAMAAIRSRNHSTIPTHHNGVRLFQQQQQQQPYRQQ